MKLASATGTIVWISGLFYITWAEHVSRFREYRMYDYCATTDSVINMDDDGVLGGNITYGGNIDCRLGIMAPKQFGKLLFYFRWLALDCPDNNLAIFDGSEKILVDLCGLWEPSPVFLAHSGNLGLRFNGTSGTHGVYLSLYFFGFTEEQCTATLQECKLGGCVDRDLTVKLCQTDEPNFCRNDDLVTCPNRPVFPPEVSSPVKTDDPSTAAVVAPAVLVPVCGIAVFAVVGYFIYRKHKHRRPPPPARLHSFTRFPGNNTVANGVSDMNTRPGQTETDIPIQQTVLPEVVIEPEMPVGLVDNDMPPSYGEVIRDQEKYHVRM